MRNQVKDNMNVLQFAYKEKWGVQDATLCIIDFVLKFLENVNSTVVKHFVKIAFNSIQPHILMEKINLLSVNSSLQLYGYRLLC